MTRVLCWNIQNFSLAKVLDPTDAAAATARLDHILNEVFGGAAVAAPAVATPDVFVVLEVYARTTEVGMDGTLFPSGMASSMACLHLLNEIRTRFGPQWNLVPPIFLGRYGFREGVAVFYNANTLQFTGPNILVNAGTGGNPIRQSQPPGETNTADIVAYPAAWGGCIAGTRTSNITLSGQPVPIPEAQRAGQWAFTTGGGVPLNFPGPDQRPPYLCSFTDLTDGNARTVNVFALHTSPAWAINAMFAIGLCPQLLTAPANSVNVLIGDFNVDPFGGNWPYNGLTAAGYTQWLTPVGPNGVAPERKAFLMTHLLPNATATPCAVPAGGTPTPVLNVYPRYGYMGSTFNGVNDTGVLDNVFTQYGAGAAGAAGNMTIVNTVVGKPFTMAAPVPGWWDDVLGGGLSYPATLANPIPAGGAPAANTLTFRAQQNYGTIIGTSDHLAVLIEV